MKAFLPLFFLSALLCCAAQPATSVTPPMAKPSTGFPGLKALLSPADYQKVGLNLLLPEDLALIDAAITRYVNSTSDGLRQQAARAAHQTAADQDREFQDRFGLPDFIAEQWKYTPSLKSRCVGWSGGNSFKLENGQVWAGFESITVELPGKNIEIAARARDQFALIVEGVNTTVRVHRIR